MPEYLEANRYLYIKTPLGPDDLLLASFAGEEGLSRLFHFELELLAENKTNVPFEDLLGQRISFGVSGIDDQSERRDFNGIVIRMTQLARDRTFTRYRAAVAPELWRLTQIFRSRIFQRKKTLEILQKLMGDAGLAAGAEYQIQGNYVPREYCVQYQETDFDFISRLLEEEGIYYFFKFSEGKHTVVFADTPQGHPELPGESKINFDDTAGGQRDDERIVSWQKMQSLQSGKYTVWDYHFELPAKHLDAVEQVIGSVGFGKTNHNLQVAQNDALEIYEYPGGYARYLDGIEKSGGDQASSLQNVFNERTRIAKVRMGQTETPMLLASGESNCRQFMAGHKFTLQRHFSGDGPYVLVDVWHSASEGSIRSDGGYEEDTLYQNTFSCIPFALPYRPPRKTPRPVMRGCQTAVVVGPSGEEIFTDKYGRVKVQFQWDREGKDDVESSCWIRVSTQWAGNQWGIIHIPRIGQEVVVDFLEGNPDQPIITGSVYNANLMPPYVLPDNKTMSGIRSRSTTDASNDMLNEIRFEDKKDSEDFFIQAQKDMDLRVKHDRKQWVGEDEHINIDRDRLSHIKRDENVTIDRDQIVQLGRDNHVAIQGKSAVKVSGSYSLGVTGDVAEQFSANHSEQTSQNLYLKAGMNLVIEAGVNISLKVGGNFIAIGPAGVTIFGTMVNINSGGSAGSGSLCSLVPPSAPPASVMPIDTTPTAAALLAAMQSDSAAAAGSSSAPAGSNGQSVAASAPTHNPKAEENKDKKHWVEIQLVDEAGQPVPGQAYEIKLPDGSYDTGTTDEKGLARVENIDPGSVDISFPDLDKDAWEPK